MNMNFYTITFACLLGLLHPKMSSAQAGELDLSFAITGKTTASFENSMNDFGNAVAIQSDGKIVMAGYSNRGGLLNNDFAVVRFNTDGTLDNSFGSNGTINAGSAGFSEKGFAMALQADGKIIVAGTSQTPAGNQNFILVRFLSNGSVDNAFGTNGSAVFDLGGIDNANAVIIQKDGKIVIGGSSSGTTAGTNNRDYVLLRVNSNGAIDNTFGAAGIVKTDISKSYDFLYALVLQSDGKVIAGGYSMLTAGQVISLARYNNDGSLDNSFGNAGKVISDLGPNSNAEAKSLAVQPDGKIVLAGISNNGSDYDFALIRYSANGTPDASFGNNGIVKTNIGTDDLALAVALQNDGKIVAGGMSTVLGNTDFALARYTVNGVLDNSFGQSGKMITDFSGKVDQINGLAIQKDGKIIAGGSSFGTKYGFAVARYLGDALVSGIKENAAKNELWIAYDHLNSELLINGTSEKGKVIITDMSGKELLIQTSSDKKTIVDAGTLASGCYMVSYFCNGSYSNLKFVKI